MHTSVNMKLGVSGGLASVTTAMASIAAKVRDIRNSINDTWNNELRKWEDIV